MSEKGVPPDYGEWNPGFAHLNRGGDGRTLEERAAAERAERDRRKGKSRKSREKRLAGD